jgi:hypothetical protein
MAERLHGTIAQPLAHNACSATSAAALRSRSTLCPISQYRLHIRLPELFVVFEFCAGSLFFAKTN